MKNKTEKRVQKMVLSALFMAVGLVLPFFTGQIPRVGQMLLPMHIPVFLCGLICGWQYGAVVGFLLPLMRSVLFGIPVLLPGAVAMAFELCTYGLLSGYLYGISRWKCVIALYRSLLIAMLGGRLVWGIVRAVIGIAMGEPFTWQMFLSGAFLTAGPGIVVQLVLIPTLMVALNRAGLVTFQGRESRERAARS